jgi:hypothetical protein
VIDMNQEKPAPYGGEELKRMALEAMRRHRDQGVMTGHDMDVCLTFSGVRRRELARRCMAQSQTAIVWSRKGPPPRVAQYVADLVEHALNAPTPPKPEEWWAANAVCREARLGLAAA